MRCQPGSEKLETHIIWGFWKPKLVLLVPGVRINPQHFLLVLSVTTGDHTGETFAWCKRRLKGYNRSRSYQRVCSCVSYSVYNLLVKSIFVAICPMLCWCVVKTHQNKSREHHYLPYGRFSSVSLFYIQFEKRVITYLILKLNMRSRAFVCFLA